MQGNFVRKRNELEGLRQDRLIGATIASGKALDHEALVREQASVVLQIQTLQQELQSKQK